MATTVRLDTRKQAVRLVFGLVVVLGVAALFAVAALVTADSVAKQIGAWALCAVFLVFGGFVAVGGALAMRPQSIVVSSEGIARDATKQPWRLGWLELDSVAVEESWRFVGRVRADRPYRRPRAWRVVLRIAPKDPAAFAARHELLDVYRGRFGASDDEWGVWLGPARELVRPLDEALRAYGSAAYRGAVDLGEAPAGLFAPTGATGPLRNRST